MLEFFKEGGWGMWAILVFGLILIGGAIRFAIRPERRQIGFLAATALTTAVCTFHATWTDVGAVLNVLSDENKVADAQVTRVLFEGLKESTRPGSFGLGLITIACMLFMVGVLRMNRPDE